ncbi:MAG: beta-L-arabinofuranosidase domain-containing protein [Candidatus Acidiferrum sp.]
MTAAAVAANSRIAKFADSIAVSDEAPMADIFVNRAPLAPNRFYSLPLTAIRPKGWLLDQLRIQARGLTGHLDEFWPDVGPQSGWLGGDGESWERGPYFLDGLLPLAHHLGDRTLLAKANKWVDWTLNNQAASGMIGPSNNDDWWPRMVMLKVLTQHEEATGDPRVVPVMQRYFAHQLLQLPERPLADWGKYRWQDEVISVIWLYNRTGDPDLLRLANLLHQQGYSWKKQFEGFQFKQKTDAKELGLAKGKLPQDRAMQTHGVNNAMGLKSSALWWLFSREASERDGVARQLAALDTYHGMPTGMFSADEHLAGKNPSQGVELCAVVENMFSLEQAVSILGDPELADRLEKIAYNALPGTLTDDMWAHQYDQQPNQIECTVARRPWTTNGPESNLYGLEPNFGCCAANMHQGWPKFASSLWMADAEGGLAAIAYAPCEVRTRIAGVAVRVEEETGYPFDSSVTVKLQPQKPLRFPLALRIPRWADGSTIRVNGDAMEPQPADAFAVLNREWRAGDHVELAFPMKVARRQWYNSSVVVERGPIVFSLGIEAEWRKLRTRVMTADWEVRPKSAWNYGLQIKEGNLQASEVRHPTRTGQSIFSLEGAPIELEIPGRKIPQWKAENSVAGELPPSPASSTEPVEKLVLSPYGAAKLRITVFPTVG